MWNIWKEELYKLASRRILWLGFLLVAVFVGMRLLSERRNYFVTIDGQIFSGQEAIDKDRELTAEYAGILTEEKVRQTYDTFGFYQYDAKKDVYTGNFCSQFITRRMTNFNQTDGESPSEVHFFQGDEWELNAAPLLDGTVWFDYSYGWCDLKEIFSFITLMALFVLFIIGLSPVFSEEYTYRTADILLTTQRGKKSCILIKMSAALFFTVTVYCVFTLYLWLLYLAVYGTQGLNASAALINVPLAGYCPSRISGFFLFAFALGLAGVVLLACMTLAVSAFCKNAFLTVVISLILFFMPYAWLNVLSGILMPFLSAGLVKAVSHFMISMPFYLAVHWGFAFTVKEIALHAAVALAAGCCWMVLGYHRYRNYQG